MKTASYTLTTRSATLAGLIIAWAIKDDLEVQYAEEGDDFILSFLSAAARDHVRQIGTEHMRKLRQLGTGARLIDAWKDLY